MQQLEDLRRTTKFVGWKPKSNKIRGLGTALPFKDEESPDHPRARVLRGLPHSQRELRFARILSHKHTQPGSTVVAIIQAVNRLQSEVVERIAVDFLVARLDAGDAGAGRWC